MMTDVNDPLEQMRQRQILAQQAAQFQSLSVVKPLSDGLYGSVVPSTQNFNGSSSKINEGWFSYFV